LNRALSSSHPISKYKAPSGTIYYVKFSGGHYQDVVAHNLHSIIELMAYRIYELYDLRIPDDTFLVLNKKNDMIGIATSELIGSESFREEMINDPDINDAFLPAVLTANYDLLGTPVGANTIKTDEGIYTLDPGGSFHFRAQGKKKPFTPDAPELQTMRDPDYPAGQVFQYLEDFTELKQKFEAVPLYDVLNAVDRTVDEANSKLKKMKDQGMSSQIKSRMETDAQMIKSSLSKRHKNILNSL